MKTLLFFILFLPLISFGQCVKVDSVYSTCEIKQMENRNVLFGIKTITEDLLQTKGYDICDAGNIVTVNITYIGVPVNTFRIAGYAISNKITEVRITVAIGNQLYEGIGKWKSQAKIMLVELENGVPFQQTTLSSAIKIALTQAIMSH
jgi:hypothetical protein